ncbi:MAG: GntR family transcriptional regulator [Acidimicrobiia bacterium]|jgi:GntR family transcriptional regulator|nr:GntR family transcriptional regulator [Acidimicrobiia bacterium]
MLEHAVSRNVVRDALSMLRDEGLIERVRGAGTFVMAGKARHHIGQLHGILDTLGAEARGGENRILSVESTRAVPIVAERLGLEPGSRCDVVEYLTLVDGEPLVGGTSYLPAPLGHRLPGGDFSVDYYHLLESVGIELSRSEAIIEAVVADETLGRLMGVRRGAPLVLFERTMYLRTGEPVEFGFHRVRGDRVALVIEQRRCRKEG